jgi:hypothetical protein
VVVDGLRNCVELTVASHAAVSLRLRGGGAARVAAEFRPPLEPRQRLDVSQGSRRGDRVPHLPNRAGFAMILDAERLLPPARLDVGPGPGIVLLRAGEE